MASSSKNSVLFVCLGNICRSPIAEAVLKHLTKKKGVSGEWVIDSCATMNYFIGDNPDPRARKVLEDKQIDYEHKARLIRQDDFTKFQYILAMDAYNIQYLKSKAPKNSTAVVCRLGEFDPEGVINVRDPYFDDDDGKDYYTCYDHCLRACETFLEAVEKGEAYKMVQILEI